MGRAFTETWQCDYRASGCLQPTFIATRIAGQFTFQLTKSTSAGGYLQFCCANGPCFDAFMADIKAKYAALP